MTQLQSIEGTWEDLIKNHSEEFAGHRVKITILPEENPRNLAQALAGLLEEVENSEFEAPDIPANNDKLFSDEMERKYEKLS